MVTIPEWIRANRVDFNARKTQCCFLTHRRNADAGVLSCVSMGNVNIAKADALDVLGMSISCDARWNDRVSKEAFKCPGFLKRCRKYLTPSFLLLTRPLSDLGWRTTLMYWPVLQSLI